MGHALNNTLQDILCRYWRMKGKDVLWQPGTDHAGIATQMVVERQLAERQQPDRRTLGREAFLDRVWAWKAESGGAIVSQLKRLGASCDWSRERFTLDEGLSRAVAKVFVQLHRDGLIYRAKRLVNWDPKFQTAISDLEVVQVECKGTFKWSREGGEPLDEGALRKVLSKNPNGHLYYFDYPVVDSGGQETGEVLTVATTRPETMLGDSAVAVHPEDPRYQPLVGKRVRLPLVGRLIAVVADEYSDPEKGTGAVKITPAHDFNDFDVGRRHEAEGARQINILDAEAKVFLKDNLAFFEGLETGEHQLARLVAETSAAIEAFRFNDAANAAYRFVWSVFCDWHLELAKPILQGGVEGSLKAETQATIAHVLDVIYALLHPFMPFVTEELWAVKGEHGGPRANCLALGPWPVAKADVDNSAGAEVEWVVGLISEIRSVRSEMGVPAAAQHALSFVQAGADIRRIVEAWGDTIKRMARIDSFHFLDVQPSGSLPIVVRDTLIALPLAGMVDIESEKARLDKDIAREVQEVAKVDAKLSNADFVARAPEEIVAENHERREASLSRIAKMEAARERLNKI